MTKVRTPAGPPPRTLTVGAQRTPKNSTPQQATAKPKPASAGWTPGAGSKRKAEGAVSRTGSASIDRQGARAEGQLRAGAERAGTASRGTTKAGPAPATAGIEAAAGRFGKVEGSNKPWAATRTVNADGVSMKGDFSRETNAPREVQRIDTKLLEAKVTRARGTTRESGSVELSANLKEGLKAKAGYTNQFIAWGYKFVGQARNLPFGFQAEGKAKTAVGTYVDVGAEAQLSKGTAYARVGVNAFAGARNIAEGTVSSPRGILSASGNVSVDGGIGVGAGLEVGVKEGKLILGSNVGAKLKYGLEAGGRVEVDFVKATDVVREAVAQGLSGVGRQFQAQRPDPSTVQGWFR